MWTPSNPPSLWARTHIYFSPYLGCRSDQFQCSNGECVPSFTRCDGYTIKEDNSNAAMVNVSLASAPQNTDGNQDCTDGSDETGCGKLATYTSSLVTALRAILVANTVFQEAEKSLLSYHCCICIYLRSCGVYTPLYIRMYGNKWMSFLCTILSQASNSCYVITRWHCNSMVPYYITLHGSMCTCRRFACVHASCCVRW